MGMEASEVLKNMPETPRLGGGNTGGDLFALNDGSPKNGSTNPLNLSDNNEFGNNEGTGTTGNGKGNGLQLEENPLARPGQQQQPLEGGRLYDSNTGGFPPRDNGSSTTWQDIETTGGFYRPGERVGSLQQDLTLAATYRPSTNVSESSTRPTDLESTFSQQILGGQQDQILSGQAMGESDASELLTMVSPEAIAAEVTATFQEQPQVSSVEERQQDVILAAPNQGDPLDPAAAQLAQDIANAVNAPSPPPGAQVPEANLTTPPPELPGNVPVPPEIAEAELQQQRPDLTTEQREFLREWAIEHEQQLRESFDQDIQEQLSEIDFKIHDIHNALQVDPTDNAALADLRELARDLAQEYGLTEDQVGELQRNLTQAIKDGDTAAVEKVVHDNLYGRMFQQLEKDVQELEQRIKADNAQKLQEQRSPDGQRLAEELGRATRENDRKGDEAKRIFVQRYLRAYRALEFLKLICEIARS